MPGIVCTDCCATECWLEGLLDGEPHRVPRPPPLLGAGHPGPQLAVGDLRQKWALTGDFIYIYLRSFISLSRSVLTAQEEFSPAGWMDLPNCKASRCLAATSCTGNTHVKRRLKIYTLLRES